jgi:hypothetical protein
MRLEEQRIRQFLGMRLERGKRDPERHGRGMETHQNGAVPCQGLFFAISFSMKRRRMSFISGGIAT